MPDKSNISSVLPSPSNESGDTKCSLQWRIYSSRIFAGRKASSPKTAIGLPSKNVLLTVSKFWNDAVGNISTRLFSKCKLSSVKLTICFGWFASVGCTSRMRLCDRSMVRSCFSGATASYGISVRRLSANIN